ncbi:MAG TPA: LON peptidase substrate-binding domain-containing protein, partial [Pyrinomonadaceae bacterium]|nr:LON peptidase substrate-binding domain-containing protein [Pyrinomonadaceae bacterium]
MADELIELTGTATIPIFPLPLVLMPYEILPLHIFEDRYREMLDDVMASNEVFGITYFEGDSQVERPDERSIGCAAQVRQVETLDDGRSNIITVGISRYRLIEYVDNGKPYNEAEVAYFIDDAEDETEAEAGAERVFKLFQRIAEAAFKMSGSRGNLPELNRGDPEQLSFLVGAGFNFENELKLELLAMTSTLER